MIIKYTTEVTWKVYNFYLDTMVVQSINKVHSINIYKNGIPNDEGYKTIKLKDINEKVLTKTIKDLFNGHVMWSE